MAEEKVYTEKTDKTESPLERAFGALQTKMVDKFKTRFNTEEENANIRSMMLGERFSEKFELVQIKDMSLTITFRNTNEEEESFATNISVTNSQEMAVKPEALANYDEEKRITTLFALATTDLCGRAFEPLDIDVVRNKIKQMREQDAEPKEIAQESMRFMEAIDDRMIEIKRRLPRGAYTIALRAFQVWMKYQAALLTGEKLENF